VGFVGWSSWTRNSTRRCCQRQTDTLYDWFEKSRSGGSGSRYWRCSWKRSSV